MQIQLSVISICVHVLLVLLDFVGKVRHVEDEDTNQVHVRGVDELLIDEAICSSCLIWLTTSQPRHSYHEANKFLLP